MTTLESSFEADFEQAILDDVEAKAEDIGEGLRETANDNWRAYASQQGYDLDHIIDSVEGPTVSRGATSVSIRLRWGGLANLYEYGVSPFTLEGSPLLQFFWDSPPEGTRPPDAPAFVEAESVNWGSVTGGIAESRAIRSAVEEYVP